MPRKEPGVNLEKVVSSKIPLADYMALQLYARRLYYENKLSQPTISHLIRSILGDWVSFNKKKELPRAGIVPYRPWLGALSHLRWLGTLSYAPESRAQSYVPDF